MVDELERPVESLAFRMVFFRRYLGFEARVVLPWWWYLCGVPTDKKKLVVRQ